MMDLVDLRFRNQLLADPLFERPAETVAWLGAVQAQDYLGALWAVGLRTRGATERSVEQALAEGAIVRLWPMRGTLHFVAAQDVRWLRALLAPHAIARAARRMRELGLDAHTIVRAKDAFARALADGRRLTREAMRRVLEDAGIDTSGQRGYQLLWRCAQDGPICPGPREGKQQTFVLLDDWVPAGRALAGDEALAELATRYFAGHGPATLRDFTWWSGLPAAQARKALELVRADLDDQELEGETYWLSATGIAAGPPAPKRTRAGTPRRPPRLLPAFDEYLVGYAKRDAVLDPAHARQVNAGGGLLDATVVLEGRVAGTWKRTLRRASASLQVRFFEPPRPADLRAVEAAADEYGKFLGLPAELER